MIFSILMGMYHSSRNAATLLEPGLMVAQVLIP